ncbi:MAG: hypothetical protein AB8G15_14760 [Saprospiraceae bacterium]
MKVLQQLLGFALLCPFAISCADQQADVLPISSSEDHYEEILTTKNWKLTSMKAVPAYQDPDSGEYISDLMSYWMDHCEMDDQLIFRMDGSTAAETGEEHCNVQADIEETGQWKFIFGNSKLQFIDLKGQSIVYDIDKITAHEIQLRSSNLLNQLSTAKVRFEAVD